VRTYSPPGATIVVGAGVAAGRADREAALSLGAADDAVGAELSEALLGAGDEPAALHAVTVSAANNAIWNHRNKAL
jgi:hypothetical protein